MKYEELMQIAAIVDKIKMTNVYQAYEQTYRALLVDQKALTLLDDYRQAQEAYASSLVDSIAGEATKAKTKQDLLAKKLEVNKNTAIHHHFVMNRTVEFFVDDLNYEINQMLGKKQKKQCGTHRKIA